MIDTDRMMEQALEETREAEARWLRRITFGLFFYLPLSMPGHILVNHYTRTIWSWPTLFLCPETIGVLILAWLSFSKSRSRREIHASLEANGLLGALLYLALVFILWVSVSAAVQHAYPGYWIRSLLAGWVLPLVLALALLGAREAGVLDAAWKGLAAGAAVLLLESLVLYFVSFGFPTSFNDLIFVNRTWKIFSGIKGKVFFGELTLGSVNDIAIFFGAGLAVLVGLLVNGIRVRTSVAAGILGGLIAALALEYLTYSRGVLLSLMAVGLVAGGVGFAVPRLRTPLTVPGLLVLLFFFVSLFAPDGSVEYWQSQFRSAGGSSAEFRRELWKGALSGKDESARFRKQASADVSRAVDAALATVAPVPSGSGARLDAGVLVNAERAAARERVSSPARRLAFGYGLGNYGLAQGMSYEAGTHNTYLDALINAGVIAFLAFCGFWLVAAAQFGRAALTQVRASDQRGSQPPPLSLLLAFCVVSLAALLVNFRFENLGTMLNGAVFWLMTISVEGRRGKSRRGPKRDWKAEAVKQWDADPCGGDERLAFGTPDFFASVEKQRYVEYAPWMRPVIGFDRYAGKRVLEVGFGLGTDHVSFARGGASCFGVDLTPAHVAATHRRLRLEGFPSRLTRGDAESLPFADQSFDVVYSFGVLHHTPDTVRSVEEIRRVLKPGGEAIVVLYHRNSAFYWGYVLVVGVLGGGFFREGYRRSLSRIEKRGHSDAIPLVKVYSRRGARRLFKGFASCDVAVEHFEVVGTDRFREIVRKLLGRGKRALDRSVGWYLIVRAHTEEISSRR